ncbi:hypothetical protein N7492_002058 [Penicillium capsulatum]|uniref:Uncharacterized protein n=1 Tax=Penicillium capsulatum TaxID=69766 RepID=A0A9W9IIQ9_9EURO|nr:hypothetical protein N7492_002058 [Penicillium capsulatum]
MANADLDGDEMYITGSTLGSQPEVFAISSPRRLVFKPARLAFYLAKINVRESDGCACGLGRETIENVLMQCDRWEYERQGLRFNLLERDVSMTRGSDGLLTHRDAAGRIRSESRGYAWTWQETPARTC